MTEAELPARGWAVASSAARLMDALRAAGPPLLFGLRLWASVCLALYVAFWLELPNAYWAGTTAAIVCQPHLGASLRKGWFRMIGTVVGAVVIVVLTAVRPCCGLRGHHPVRSVASVGDFRGIEHGDGALSRSSGNADGASFAGDVYPGYCHVRQFRAAARTSQSDELRYGTILQFRAVDHRRRRSCGSVFSVAATALSGVPGRAALGTDLA